MQTKIVRQIRKNLSKSWLSAWSINLLILVIISCIYTIPAQAQRYYEAVDPNFNADSVNNPTPRYEPKSHYGNPKSYTVFGKKYRVLDSAKNYDKVGIASWYGPKFNHRKTSSGEEYNMYQMTAANKELPLPTYVEVTNLENHKQIIVKINDRGPFHQGRIIDLSYAAAKKLGMAQKGTAKVRVRAIDSRYYNPNLDQRAERASVTYSVDYSVAYYAHDAEPGFKPTYSNTPSTAELSRFEAV